MLLHRGVHVRSVGDGLVQLWCTAGTAELIWFHSIVIEIARHIDVENNVTISAWCTRSRFWLSSIMSFFRPYTA